MVAPEPGRMPTIVPMTPERAMVGAHSLVSVIARAVRHGPAVITIPSITK